MYTQYLSACFDQRFVIAQRLGADQCAKRETFGRDIKICRRLGRDHKKKCILWSTFMELTRRMLEAWSKTGGHRIAGFGTDGGSHLLQGVDHLFSPRQIGVDGNIPIRLRVRKEI